jgi:site-specific DNA recombinase
MAVRAVGYFREDAGARGPSASLADQNRRFLEFCRARDFEVTATFHDVPGERPDRSGYRQLLDHVRRRAEGVVVVVDSVDRLGKDMRQAARAFFQLAGLGVRVVSVSDGLEDPTTLLLQHWNAREAGERQSERVRDAMRRRAVKGEVLGRPPYGYRVGPNRRLAPVAEEAELVRHMFRLYTQEGLGIRLIARRLNEEGYRTRRGGNWSMVTIRDILRNRVYLGTYARFGVRVPGSHPALINPDDFRRAQDRMESRRTADGPRKVSQFLLSGLAYCGACGNRMIGVSRRQSWTRRSDGGVSSAEYRYYQCGSRTNQSVCDYHTWRVEQLEAEVRLATCEALQRSLAGEGGEEASGNAIDTPTRIRSRMRNLDRELDRLMEQAAAGLLSRERLRAQSIDIARRQLELEEQQGREERRTREREARAERQQLRQSVLDRLRDDWEGLPFEERQALLRDVLDKVVVHDDHVELMMREE